VAQFVSLFGGNGDILDHAEPTPQRAWMRYELQMLESTQWTLRKTSTHPTQQQFRDVINGLTKVLIAGEFITGYDRGGLDNVMIHGGTVCSAYGPMTALSIPLAQSVSTPFVSNPLSVYVITVSGGLNGGALDVAGYSQLASQHWSRMSSGSFLLVNGMVASFGGGEFNGLTHSYNTSVVGDGSMLTLQLSSSTLLTSSSLTATIHECLDCADVNEPNNLNTTGTAVKLPFNFTASTVCINASSDVDYYTFATHPNATSPLTATLVFQEPSCVLDMQLASSYFPSPIVAQGSLGTRSLTVTINGTDAATHLVVSFVSGR
jgi:hypothetical protein